VVHTSRVQRKSTEDAGGTPMQARPVMTIRWLFNLQLDGSKIDIVAITHLQIQVLEDRFYDLFPQDFELLL
jgi:hypothetical protein